jgi:hypothetical protein
LNDPNDKALTHPICQITKELGQNQNAWLSKMLLLKLASLLAVVGLALGYCPKK